MLRRALFACSALMVFSVPQVSHANQIGLGIDWRKGIFIQEYWQNTHAYYEIANTNKTDVTLTAKPWGASDLTPKAISLGTIPAGSVIKVNAAELIGKGLMEFDEADGTSIGLLQAPVTPVSPAPTPDASDATYRSFDGVNNSGGRHQDIWFEQGSLDLYCGERRLTIKTGNNFSSIKVLAAPQMGALSVPKLLGVTCPTLIVTKAANGDYMITPRASADSVPAIHSIEVSYDIPNLSVKTMLGIDSVVELSGGRGSFHLARGIIVAKMEPIP